eukprot:c22310_g1_i2 orf=100-564(+)
MSYMRGSLIRRTEMLLKSKVIPHKPKWFDAVVNPSTFEPGLGRKLAHRWMELVELGFMKERALDIVDAEYVNQKRVENRAYDDARRKAFKEGLELPPPRKMINRYRLLEKQYFLEGLRKLKQQEAAPAPVQDVSVPASKQSNDSYGEDGNSDDD